MPPVKNKDPISLTTIVNKAIRDCDGPFVLKAETVGGITRTAALTCNDKTAVLRVDGDNTFIEDENGRRLMPVFATAGSFPVSAPIALVMEVVGQAPQKPRSVRGDDDPNLDELLATAKGTFAEDLALIAEYAGGFLTSVTIETKRHAFKLALDDEKFSVRKDNGKSVSYAREDDDAIAIFVEAWE